MSDDLFVVTQRNFSYTDCNVQCSVCTLYTMQIGFCASIDSDAMHR